MDKHQVRGYYRIISSKIVDKKQHLDDVYAKALAEDNKHALNYGGYEAQYRIEFELGEYQILKQRFTYGLQDASKGRSLTRSEFNEYCKGTKVLNQEV